MPGCVTRCSAAHEPRHRSACPLRRKILPSLGQGALSHPNRPSSDPNNPPFSFLDLCGGPGGFSQYILWRCEAEGRECNG